MESLYRLVWSADFNNLISYKALAVPDQLSTEHCTFKVAKDYLLLNLYTSMGTIRGLDGKIKISTNFLRFLDTVKFFDISYTERPISHLKKPKLMPRTYAQAWVCLFTLAWANIENNLWTVSPASHSLANKAGRMGLIWTSRW